MEKQKFAPPICPRCGEEEVFSEDHGGYLCMCYLFGKKEIALGNVDNTQREKRCFL